jgi:hypothetical protein
MLFRLLLPWHKIPYSMAFSFATLMASLCFIVVVKDYICEGFLER